MQQDDITTVDLTKVYTLPTILEQLLGVDLEHFVREIYKDKMHSDDSIILEAVYARHRFHIGKLKAYMDQIYYPILDNQISIGIDEYIGWINNSLL